MQWFKYSFILFHTGFLTKYAFSTVGTKMPPYITLKLNIMEAPNLACWFEFIKSLQKRLVSSWWRHHCDVTAIFWILTSFWWRHSGSSFVNIYLFILNHKMPKLSYVTKTSYSVVKYLRISCSDFGKWLQKSSKIGKLLDTLADLKF